MLLEGHQNHPKKQDHAHQEYWQFSWQQGSRINSRQIVEQEGNPL